MSVNEHKPMVLLVEDDPELRRLNARALLRAGYDVAEAGSLAETAEALQAARPDVIVLDILLPDGNGLEWLPSLRQHSTAPVLFLSVLNRHEEVLRGIEAGGDDYMTKPHRLDELLVRVAALWRREKQHRDRLAEQAADAVLQRGPLRLEVGTMRAYVEGRDALLTQKEFLLLLALVRAAGQEVPGPALYQAAWGTDAGGDLRALRQQIYKLRAKLGMQSGGPIDIVTEYGRGYRFLAEG